MSSNDTSISRWISVLYRFRKGYVNKRLDPYGIGGGQFIFLMTLYRHDGASQEKVCDYLKIDKTTTAKALKKLENSGFIIRKTDTEDKRAYKIYLTQKALDIIPLIYETVNRWQNKVTSNISEDEKQMLENILHKMSISAFEINKNDQIGVDE